MTFFCPRYRLVNDLLVMIMHLESSGQNVHLLNINFLKNSSNLLSKPLMSRNDLALDHYVGCVA